MDNYVQVDPHQNLNVGSICTGSHYGKTSSGKKTPPISGRYNADSGVSKWIHRYLHRHVNKLSNLFYCRAKASTFPSLPEDE